ncbi:MAG: BON domain-containing protein [Bryobacterales bacterium]|nr:BON domain-containing protein [Bryobacterales bacterium]
MTVLAKYVAAGTFVAMSTLAGCAASPPLSVDVTRTLRQSLDAAGLKDVTIKQDREKGVVTLGGLVGTDDDKARAELLAKPIAAGQVLAVEIAVIPDGAEKDAKAINTELDKGIEHNLDAALIAKKLRDSVKYKVKNSVVTLSGEVGSQATRAMAEQLAAAVPYVTQVVNTLQVKNQKATSTN